MTALTARQVVVLATIESHIRARGYPPTLRELGKQLGIRSTNGVTDHLKALERKGSVSPRPGDAVRSLVVLRPSAPRPAMPAVPRVDGGVATSIWRGAQEIRGVFWRIGGVTMTDPTRTPATRDDFARRSC